MGLNNWIADKFKNEFQKGLEGKNKGFPCGLPSLNLLANGLRKKSYTLIAAENKVGKTTFVDSVYVLTPFYYRNKKEDFKVKYIYFNIDTNPTDKIASWISFYIKMTTGKYLDSKRIGGFTLQDNKMLDAINTNNIEATKLSELKKQANLTPLSSDEIKWVEEAMTEFIIPLTDNIYFNKKNSENLTGILKTVKNIMSEYGVINDDKYHNYTFQLHEKYADYHFVLIFDNFSRLNTEKDMTLKMAIDTTSHYFTIFRDVFEMSCIALMQLNVAKTYDPQTVKMMGSKPRIQKTDFKDSTVPNQDANMGITLLDPNLFQLKEYDGKIVTETFRYVDILFSRDTKPFGFPINLDGGTYIVTEKNITTKQKPTF